MAETYRNLKQLKRQGKFRNSWTHQGTRARARPWGSCGPLWSFPSGRRTGRFGRWHLESRTRGLFDAWKLLGFSEPNEDHLADVYLFIPGFWLSALLLRLSLVACFASNSCHGNLQRQGYGANPRVWMRWFHGDFPIKPGNFKWFSQGANPRS